MVKRGEVSSWRIRWNCTWMDFFCKKINEKFSFASFSRWSIFEHLKFSYVQFSPACLLAYSANNNIEFFQFSELIPLKPLSCNFKAQISIIIVSAACLWNNIRASPQIFIAYLFMERQYLMSFTTSRKTHICISISYYTNEMMQNSFNLARLAFFCYFYQWWAEKVMEKLLKMWQEMMEKGDFYLHICASILA